MLPFVETVFTIADTHPQMTCKEVQDVVNILIEAGIVKDERPQKEETDYHA